MFCVYDLTSTLKAVWSALKVRIFVVMSSFKGTNVGHKGVIASGVRGGLTYALPSLSV
jgi:hypothetical protein